MAISVKSTGSIKGFNRTTGVVQSYHKLAKSVRVFAGYKFRCLGCGTEKRFATEHFHDPYGGAIAALERHHCP